MRGGVVAVLAVWAVLIPEFLAYATIAGMSPVVGLYAAVPAGSEPQPLGLAATVGSSVIAPGRERANCRTGRVQPWICTEPGTEA